MAGLSLIISFRSYLAWLKAVNMSRRHRAPNATLDPTFFIPAVISVQIIAVMRN